MDSSGASQQEAGDLLRQLAPEVLQRWETRARDELPRQGEQPLFLRETLPAWLDQLAAALREEQAAELPSMDDPVAGLQHPESSGASVQQLMREYHLLREVLLEVLEAHTLLGQSARLCIHRSIDHALECEVTRQMRAAREALQEVEEHHRLLVESARDYAMFLLDSEGKITSWNPGAERITGYSAEEILGQRGAILFTPEDRARGEHEKELRQADLVGRAEDERWHLRKDGSRFFASGVLVPLRSGARRGYAKVMRDITQRRRAEEAHAQLLESERQKSEQLVLSIRETHHRIKNNLQAVADLLYLQQSSAGRLPTAEVLQECINRVQAVAIVHDLLSYETDIRSVDVRAMVDRLVPTGLRSNGLELGSVSIDIQVPRIAVSSKKATALALILNELVCNAAKHALARQKDGRLAITLTQEAEELVLQIQDNGPGLPPDFDIATHANMGLQIVQTLAKRDLDGGVALTEQRGVRARIWFPW